MNHNEEIVDPEVQSEGPHTEENVAESEPLNEIEETEAQWNEAEAEPEVEYVEKSLLEEAQKKADESYQRYLRSQADLENFRRRVRLEKEESAKYAAQGFIEQLLPVIDNFDRALAASKENQDLDSLIKGLDMIYRQMFQALEQEGVKVIDAVGEPFDPHFHEAVAQVESEEHDEGIVVEELQKGYILKDRVIRASMVKVAMK